MPLSFVGNTDRRKYSISHSLAHCFEARSNCVPIPRFLYFSFTIKSYKYAYLQGINKLNPFTSFSYNKEKPIILLFPLDNLLFFYSFENV